MRGEIDPQVPFIQVHRSVGPKAASLAQVLKVTYQHARGSLDVFWEGLADRRILAGKSELMLTAKELETRLLLAFGQPVDLDHLVHLGLLEPRDGRYRVRGMSRYLVMEASRVAKKGKRPRYDLDDTTASPRSDPGVTGVASGRDPVEVRGKREEEIGESEEGEREKQVSLSESEPFKLITQKPPDVVAELRDLWNEVTTAPISKWREGREKLAREALRRRPLEQWREVFTRINSSSFCRGADGGWRADIDWALRPEGKKPETAAKVLEGAFDRAPAPKPRDMRHPVPPAVFTENRVVEEF